MRNSCFMKGLVVAVILLFICIGIQPAFANNDDTTPPVTTHTLDPPEPDGLNGWYISDVNVTLSAIDISGINATYYRIKSGEWEIYNSPFVISKDGNDILIEYYSVDNVGNVEDVKSFMVDIDQTEPDITLGYDVTGGDDLTGYDFWFIANAKDDCSDMDRVEFYFRDKLQDTINGSGPEYWWILHYPFWCRIIGFICNREITEDYVSFYAIIVGISLLGTPSFIISAYAYDNAGNFNLSKIRLPYVDIHGIYLFQNITYPNKYNGYLGRNFIFASFDISNIDLY